MHYDIKISEKGAANASKRRDGKRPHLVQLTLLAAELNCTAQALPSFYHRVQNFSFNAFEIFMILTLKFCEI